MGRTKEQDLRRQTMAINVAFKIFMIVFIRVEFNESEFHRWNCEKRNFRDILRICKQQIGC